VHPGNPFQQLGELRDAVLDTLAMERRRPPARAQAWQPALDVAVTDAEYILLLDLPGVKREEVQALAQDGVLRIRGVSGDPEAAGGAHQVRRERPLGPFVRSLHLPTDADLSAISAKLADGVLDIRVARRQPQSTQIRIEIGS